MPPVQRRAPAALIALFAAAALGAPVDADVETTRLEVPRRAFEQPRQEWYGIYAEGDKLGYLSSAMRFEPEEGGRFVVVSEMHLKVIALGQKREVQTVETLVFDGSEPYRLRSGHSVIDQGPYRQEITLTSAGSDYEARILAADSQRRLSLPDPDYTLADVLTPEVWFGGQRQPGEVLATRAFSLSDLAPATDTYTVRGLKSTLVDGVAMSYYEVGLHSSAAGAIGTALFDVDGLLVSGSIGGAFELRLEPPERARDFDYAADVYLLGMVEIDRPIGDPHDVTGLVVEVEGSDPEKIPTAANQLSSRDDSGRWLLSLGPERGAPQAAAADEVTAALAESVHYPIHEPAVRELAREAIGAAETPRQRVEALVAFVDRFLVDSYSAEPLTVLDMLSVRQGDCTEHAQLFTTLARSLGIPAREVTGLVYLGDDVQAFGGHAWNEVVLDGHWRPVDATWGEVDLNATHVLLGPRTGNDAAAETLFGGYRFNLIEVERR